MEPSQDSPSRLVAVCIRCGHQALAAASCTACGGVVIQTRESQAVRESSRELSAPLRLPGVSGGTRTDDMPRRFARGTLPPLERPAEVDTSVPELGGGTRVVVVVLATLVSAGLLGLIAALLVASF